MADYLRTKQSSYPYDVRFRMLRCAYLLRRGDEEAAWGRWSRSLGSLRHRGGRALPDTVASVVPAMRLAAQRAPEWAAAWLAAAQATSVPIRTKLALSELSPG